MSYKSVLKAASAAVMLVASAALPAFAQETETASTERDKTLDTVVTVGTRVANRTALDTAVAVDVVPAATLENIGVGELNQALSVQLPSFNFPRPALADGTDSVRPATLRLTRRWSSSTASAATRPRWSTLTARSAAAPRPSTSTRSRLSRSAALKSCATAPRPSTAPMPLPA